MLHSRAAPPEVFPYLTGLETVAAESGVFGIQINGEGIDQEPHQLLPQVSGLAEPLQPVDVEREDLSGVPEEETSESQELTEVDTFAATIEEHSAEDEARQAQLLEAAKQGDMDAYGLLIQEIGLQDTLFRYIYYRVNSKELALDLTQETLLRAMRRISTVVDTSQGVEKTLSGWHVVIARNLISDHYKSSRVKREVSTGEMLDPGEFVPSPEDEVVGSISSLELRLALLELNDQQYMCVKLRFIDGLSIAETAAIMGKNEGAIKTLQYRAVRTLGRMPTIQALAPMP